MMSHHYDEQHSLSWDQSAADHDLVQNCSSARVGHPAMHGHRCCCCRSGCGRTTAAAQARGRYRIRIFRICITAWIHWVTVSLTQWWHRMVHDSSIMIIHMIWSWWSYHVMSWLMSVDHFIYKHHIVYTRNCGEELLARHDASCCKAVNP